MRGPPFSRPWVARAGIVPWYARKGGSFSPADLPGLALWLDASDLTTITHDLGAVSQWDDKSGNGRHATQGTAAAQPTTNARTINGNNGLDFDGTGDALLVAGYSFSTAHSLFMAVEVDADSFVVFASNATSSFWALGIDGSASAPQGGSAGTTPAIRVDGEVLAPYTRNAMFHAVNPGSGPSVVSVLGATPAVSVTFRFGTYANDTVPLNGVIGEVIAYSGTLSVGDAGVVEAYLAEKWGVTLA